MSREIEIKNILDQRQTRPSPDLAPFIRAVLQKRSAIVNPNKPEIYWLPEYFGLHKLKIGQEAAPEQQGRILRSLNQGLVEESFYIEKSGMTYTSKMSLLAELNDERSLYNMLAADEAVHFQMISSYLLDEPAPYEQQPFLRLLDAAVHEGGYSSLIFIAQVLLEGWGLAHYMSLLKNCQNEDFRGVFRMILNDEAIHHGSGLVMTRKHPFLNQDKDIVLSIIKEFFSLVQIGPLRIASAIAQELGSLNKSDLVTIFDELEAKQSITENLSTLKKLVREHTPDSSLIQFIETNRLDISSSNTQFAEFLKGKLS